MFRVFLEHDFRGANCHFGGIEGVPINWGKIAFSGKQNAPTESHKKTPDVNRIFSLVSS